MEYNLNKVKYIYFSMLTFYSEIEPKTQLHFQPIYIGIVFEISKYPWKHNFFKTGFNR